MTDLPAITTAITPSSIHSRSWGNIEEQEVERNENRKIQKQLHHASAPHNNIITVSEHYHGKSSIDTQLIFPFTIIYNYLFFFCVYFPERVS